MIKVLIADDHPLVRIGLKKTLSAESDIQILGDAKNSMEVLDFLRHHRVDVVVLDINMPGTSGLTLLADMKNLKMKTRVLVLSMYPEESFAIRALHSGASGYLTKESAPEDLAKAIRKVAGGGKYITPAVAEKLVDEIAGNANKAPHELLSEREFEVFMLIARGKTVGDIADVLSLSVATISTHRTRILEKMSLKTNADIVQYAYANNILR
ncbi:MAG: response regulator transcription factor [Bacteroidota bacterium]